MSGVQNHMGAGANRGAADPVAVSPVPTAPRRMCVTPRRDSVIFKAFGQLDYL